MDAIRTWGAVATALAAGEATAFAFPAFAPLWPVAAAACVVLPLLAAGRGMRRLPLAALASFLAGAALAMHCAASRRAALDAAMELNRGRPFSAVVEIPDAVRTSPRRDGALAVSFNCEIRGVPAVVRMTAAHGAAIPAPGETWRVAGWLDGRRGLPFNERRSIWVRGSRAFAERVAAEPRSGFRAAMRRAKADLSRRVGLGLDNAPDAAAFNRAILLGERSALPRSSTDAFAAAGTIHVFAISGLHVLVLARLAELLLIAMAIPSRLRGLVLIPLLWLYASFVGMGPSVVRAAAMASVNLAAPIFWRKPDSLVSWLAVFTVVHAADPESLMDVGSLLSFAVMLALVAWGKIAADWRRGFFAALCVSLVAWCAGAPIVARAFGRLAPGGIAANLAMVPAASVAVVASALGVGASFASDALAAHLNACAALATEFMAGLSHLVAALPFAVADAGRWSLASCALWYAALTAAMVFLHRRREGRASSRPQW